VYQLYSIFNLFISTKFYSDNFLLHLGARR